MADEIIDLTRYLQREPSSDLPRGSMAIWGGEGERSRFALPLWRIIHVAQSQRGMILSYQPGQHRYPQPYVVLDLGADPARTEITPGSVPRFGEDEGPSLIDREEDGLVVFLGADRGRVWALVVDGGGEREGPLSVAAREDILFLAGECAGLLFLRHLGSEKPES